MMPASIRDPYQELEAYLRQAEDEVGKAVEDLLASQTPNDSHLISFGLPRSRKNSCPQLFEEEAATTENVLSSSVPRIKRSYSSTDSRDDQPAVRVNGSHQIEECTWDPYYDWSSLKLSRPPSGDANLLAVYTDRLLEAVNGSFAEDAEHRDIDGHQQHEALVNGCGNRDQVEERVPELCLEDETAEASAQEHEEGSSGSSSVVTTTGKHTTRVANTVLKKHPSWPCVVTTRTDAYESLLGRSSSYPGCLRYPSHNGDMESCEPSVIFDGSLYKNQKLFGDSETHADTSSEESKQEDVFSSDARDDSFQVTEVPPLERLSIGEWNLGNIEGFTKIELRIEEPDDVEELPALFIKENEHDEVPVRKALTLDLHSAGSGNGALDPYMEELTASNSTTPDEVFTVTNDLKPHSCTLDQDRLCSLTDMPSDGTATWSSTSTTHSGSVVSRQDLEEFLKSVEPPHDPPSPQQDAITQTSPQVSRSSSFTWVMEGGDDLCSSKESLGTPVEKTATTATTSPSPVLSSSSCEGPLTPLTPRASPCSQGAPVDTEGRGLTVENAIRALGRLEGTASPSMPTLVTGRSAETGGCAPAVKGPDTQSLRRPSSRATNGIPPSPNVVYETSPQQLNQKACSAPVLLKTHPPTSLGILGKRVGMAPGMATSSASNTPEEEVKVFLQERSHSAKDIKEVEAVHACEWLRQAGFPQYVQTYEDNSFPVEITTVLKDHPNLDQDELQSLFRRLNTLNKCARMKRDGLVKQSIHHDSDEDEGLALSNNWQFHRGSRRWSRVSPPLPVVVTPTKGDSRTQETYSSHDSVFLDEPRSSPDSRLSTSDERIIGGPDEGSPGPKLRRSGSERIRDAILRRMDSFRGTRRRKKRAQDGTGNGDDNTKNVPWSTHLCPEGHALSDSECSPQLDPRKKTSSAKSKHKEQQPPRWLTTNMDVGRNSIYDNVPTIGGAPQSEATGIENQARDNSSVGSGSLGGGQDDQGKVNYVSERRDSGVGSSLTRPGNGSPSSQSFPWHCFTSANEQLSCVSGQRYDQLSASQLLVLRKLAMLRLTALMERFSPPYRSGWGWAVPKFIKRMRAPDYKDKAVFGVPLSVSLQRTGHALPPSIQGAMDFLRKSASDSTGLFRKSGVRSRIQKLRSLHESSTTVNYEPHQAYDVADLLKQYFRELPEGLLTSKLSDTFLCIFQHIPEEYRLDALQAAILLMPDENREVLETLLVFLDDVCRHAQENQMTAVNVAVCFAPSLFQLAVQRSASASPRRRATTVGIPDQRELSENRAAHECLTCMIAEHQKLFQIPVEMMQQCHLEKYEPATVEELGNLKSYLDGCLHALLVEAREKGKGWTVIQHPEVEVAFKKLGDGLPLRLWRCAVEVEAPPVELLTRILRERHIWDSTLLKWRLVARLDKQAEIIQYICSSMKPHALREFCILRSWRTELAKGSCALIELSVNDPRATVPPRGVRGVVLGSRYLIEPCGAGKSRVMHLSRIDFRGRTPEWYNKVYGHLSALLLTRLRDSFAQRAVGPETKV